MYTCPLQRDHLAELLLINQIHCKLGKLTATIRSRESGAPLRIKYATCW
jgi:hypothetical protein